MNSQQPKPKPPSLPEYREDANSPWYRRIQFEVRAVYQMFPGRMAVTEWALNAHRIWTVSDKSGRPCWWAAGAIRVLGLDFGAGVFISRTAPDTPNPPRSSDATGGRGLGPIQTEGK